MHAELEKIISAVFLLARRENDIVGSAFDGIVKNAMIFGYRRQILALEKRSPPMVVCGGAKLRYVSLGAGAICNKLG